jgi:hypothetical protein
MYVCLCLFCICVVLCVGRGLATGCYPVQGVLPNVYRIKKLKKRPRSKGLKSHRERERERERERQRECWPTWQEILLCIQVI